MSDHFDLEAFIQSLIETVVWCRHHLEGQEGDVTWSLTGDESELWHLTDEQLKQHSERIIAERSEKVKSLVMPSYGDILPIIQQGRFLIFYPGTTTSDGVAKIVSDGYFDYDNYPPWDTWVYYKVEDNHSVYLGSLIAWVAPEFVGRVRHAIESCSDESILWLTDHRNTISFREALKAANLWI